MSWRRSLGSCSCTCWRSRGCWLRSQTSFHAAIPCPIWRVQYVAAAAQDRRMMLELSRIECLGDALRDAMLTYKSRIALYEADRQRENARFSYHELLREAERVTTRLQEAGVEPGDRVAILMSNQSRWVMSGHGALYAGAVIVPIDYKLTAKEQIALLAHAKPKLLITEYGIWRSLLRETEGAAAKQDSGKAAVLVSRIMLTTEAKPGANPLEQATRWETPTPTGRFRHVHQRKQRRCCVHRLFFRHRRHAKRLHAHARELPGAGPGARAHVLDGAGRTCTSRSCLRITPSTSCVGTILPFFFGAAK